MEKILRDFFLFLSKNKTMSKLAKRYGLHFGASRFVAGESIGQAVAVIKELNRKGLAVTVDYLGEFVDNEAEAKRVTERLIEAIEVISAEKLDSQLSLKLTSLGLDICDQLVLKNMRCILEAAGKNNVFVTIDMEDFSRCQKTIDLFKKLRSEYNRVGTVIQAYLYRSEQDIIDLSKYAANLRLVKGAYKEPEEVAFPDKKDVDRNFMKLIKIHLLNGHYTAVATHDDAIIEYTKRLVRKYHIPHDQFEFQMLYGIRPERQLQLVQEGYKMRVYVPYGTDWFGYFMRRLAERPANVGFVLRGMLKK
jgi:proline dehydrogenase